MLTAQGKQNSSPGYKSHYLSGDRSPGPAGQKGNGLDVKCRPGEIFHLVGLEKGPGQKCVDFLITIRRVGGARLSAMKWKDCSLSSVLLPVVLLNSPL